MKKQFETGAGAPNGKFVFTPSDQDWAQIKTKAEQGQKLLDRTLKSFVEQDDPANETKQAVGLLRHMHNEADILTPLKETIEKRVMHDNVELNLSAERANFVADTYNANNERYVTLINEIDSSSESALAEVLELYEEKETSAWKNLTYSVNEKEFEMFMNYVADRNIADPITKKVITDIGAQPA